jgi:molybdate transport system ATP-binding protein
LDVHLLTNARSLAVVGPSGAGKSSLLRILAGVERSVPGLVRFAGEIWSETSTGTFLPPWGRRVGWVPQDNLLFPHLSVRENLAFAGASPEEVAAVARDLGAADLLGRRPGRLSGGERQRVALGRALLSRPRLLLLDEPFSALDRPLRKEVAGVVDAFSRRSGAPLVLVSHDEEDVGALVEERWILTEGSLSPLP